MHRIRLAVIAVAACLQPTLGYADSGTAQTGHRTEMAVHTRFDGQCRAARVEITLIKPPAHGTVTWGPKDSVIPAVNRNGVPQPPQCVGRTIPGVAIYYQPNPGFVGTDNFRYRRINADRSDDRFNGEVNYTVEVH